MAVTACVWIFDFAVFEARGSAEDRRYYRSEQLDIGIGHLLAEGAAAQ